MLLKDLPAMEAVEKRGVRYYKIAGVKELYPSVTTVTGNVLNKPFLVPWAKKVALEHVRQELLGSEAPTINGELADILWPDYVDGVIERASQRPDQIKEEAASLGTRVHAAIDAIIKGEGHEITPDIKPGVDAFLAWRDSQGIEIVQSEVRVFSHNLKVAGCVDAIGRKKNGDLVILDWKTSKGVYLEMGYQVGGYVICVSELLAPGAGEIKEAWVIRFPKTIQPGEVATPEPHKIRNLEVSTEGFYHCRALYGLNKQKMYDE